MRQTQAEYYRRYLYRHRARFLIRTAKVRAVERGLPFDLGDHEESIQARIDANACQVTGLPFNLNDGLTWDSPSLDRIDPAQGYVHSNVRVVLHAANCAMGNWGEAVFLRMAQAMVDKSWALHGEMH